MKYVILLDVPENDVWYRALAVFSRAIKFGDLSVLEISATSANFDGQYLRVTLETPEDLKGLELRIPHKYVAMAYGEGESNRKIPFQFPVI
jgi:hypothetical protein